MAVSSAHQAARAEEVAQAPPHWRTWAASAVAVAVVGVDLPQEWQAGWDATSGGMPLAPVGEAAVEGALVVAAALAADVGQAPQRPPPPNQGLDGGVGLALPRH